MYKSVLLYWLLLIPFVTLKAQDPNTCRVVFTVDMQKEEVSAEGVFINGNFFNEMDLEMDSVGNGQYQFILRVTKNDILVYNFKNGTTLTETIAEGSDCLAPDNSPRRLLVVPDADSLQVPLACYGSCQDCDANSFFTSSVQIRVDMTGQEVPEEGMFIKGNFFNEVPIPMVKEEQNIWSYKLSATVGDTLTYQFGKGMFEAETISEEESCLKPGSPDSRMAVVLNTQVQVLPTVCFGSCIACQTTNTVDLVESQGVQLVPSIAKNQTQLIWSNTTQQNFQVQLFNSSGQLMQEYKEIQQSPFLLSDLPTQSGLYLVTIHDNKGGRGALKLIIK